LETKFKKKTTLTISADLQLKRYFFLSDGDEIMSMQRKNLKQLLREQRNVQQSPTATSSSPSPDPSSSGRPYGKRTWPGVRADALDVKQLGWKETEGESAEKVILESAGEEARKEKPQASATKAGNRPPSASAGEKGAPAKGKGGKPPAKGTADGGASKAGTGKKGTEARESSGTPEVTTEGAGKVAYQEVGADPQTLILSRKIHR
jgi:hypothetical protein